MQSKGDMGAMDFYLPRIADTLLEAKGAVLIQGPQMVWKDHDGKKTANSVLEMDRPDMTKQYQDMAELSPLRLLEGDTPR